VIPHPQKNLSSSFVANLKDQPRDIHTKIMSYLNDEDRDALKRSCMEIFGSQHIHLGITRAKDRFEYHTRHVKVFYLLEKYCWINVPQEYLKSWDRLKINTDFPEFFKDIVMLNMVLGFGLFCGVIGAAPALANYAIAGVFSISSGIAGGVEDYQRKYYPGLFLLKPSEARKKPSEQTLPQNKL
jgi:hypothetical protein